MLIATIVLAVTLLMLFPGFILKKGYGFEDAAIVIAIWSLIMTIRTLRQPDAVLLQAAGLFVEVAGRP